MNEGTVEERLAALGLTLPPPGEATGLFVKYVQTGNLLFLSGSGADQPGYTAPKGKVGATVTLEQAKEAARYTALNLLATAKEALGSLERVHRVVKLLGMVNCVPEFGDTPQVINGCSEVFVAAFGDAGRHARSAVGFVTLPGQMPVEIEAIFEVA